ncbi:MAG TPA: hypothetical protein VH054_04490 [Polyangiaceae bacterium]|nr:hypothetical protein [Polyangiaceae bacterium]
MSPIRYDDDALTELESAFEYYAARDVDLALRFQAEVRAIETIISETPAFYPVFEERGGVRIHRALLDDFPFAVLYVETPKATWIVALMHLRREPGYWRRRV